MKSLMPAFDQPGQRRSAEVAAATEAADRFPTDAALIVHGQQQRFKRIAATSRSHPEELAAMVLELQSNRAILDGLADWYGVFVFTGGAVPTAQWDIAAGLVMLFSRYLPIVAPIAMAAYLGRKKKSPFSQGTLRDDTLTFAFLLLGTILIIGALLFLPVAALGPLAEHLGPIPFGS